MVVVAAGGEEHGAVAHALLLLQPDHVPPEAERAVEVRRGIQYDPEPPEGWEP